MAKLRIEDYCSISLGLALVGLLLPLNLSNIAVGVLLVTSFVAFLLDKQRKFPSANQWVFAGFFLLFIVGIFFTEDLKYGLRILERNIVWVLIPLLVPLGLRLSKRSRYKPFLAFVIGIHLLVAFLFINALIRFFDAGDSLVFYNVKLTEVINFHPVYLAVYFLFAMLTLFYLWSEKYLLTPRYLKVIIVIFDVIALILLSSKMVLGSLIFISLFLVIRKYRSRKAVIGSLLGVLLLGVVVMQFEETRNRINDSLFSSWELLEKETFLYNDPFTGITVRLITWKFTMQKFFEQENVLLGVGTGDGRNFINDVYRDRKMDDAGYLNFNMHNQYLEYLIKFGVLGLIYFLTILFLSFKKAIQGRNSLYFSFLLIFCIFSMTESNLEVQRGIVFFVLINTIFYFSPEKSIEKKNV